MKKFNLLKLFILIATAITTIGVSAQSSSHQRTANIVNETSAPYYAIFNLNETLDLCDNNLDVTLVYPCNKIDYQVKCNALSSFNKIKIDVSTDEGKNYTKLKEHGNIKNTSWSSFDAQINTNVNKVAFVKTEGTSIDMNIKQIKFTIAPHLILTSETIDFGNVEFNGGNKNMNIEFQSFYNANGELKITSNTNPNVFRITTTKIADKGKLKKVNTSDYAVQVSFYPNTVGEHTSTVTISDGQFTKTITLKGVGTKKAQTITWKNTKQICIGETLINPASALNNATITYSSSNPEIIAVEGNILRPLTEGKATITATVAETDTYFGATSTKEFESTNKTLQTITWEQDFYNLRLGGNNIRLDATASSQMDVTYTSDNENVVKIEGNVLSIIGEGQTYIHATQAGNETYAAITESKFVYVRNSDACANYALAKPDKDSKSGALNWDPIVITHTLTAPGDKLSFNATCDGASTGRALRVYDDLGNNYVNSTSIGNHSNIQIDKKAKTLTFVLEANLNRSISNIYVTQATYLEATKDKVTFESTEIGSTASTSIGVSYSNFNDIITIALKNGTNFSIDKTFINCQCGQYGTEDVKITLDAKEIGNIRDILVVTCGDYTFETPIEAEIIKHYQFITWTQDLTALNPTQGNSYDLSASASSGLAVTFSSSNENVARIEGGKLVVVGAGSATITATQTGNENFEAATPIEKSISVAKLNQSITWNQEFNQYLTVGETYQLAATASSGLDVTYTSSDENVAHISGNNVIIRAVGNATISAIQNGNANYNAASVITKTITAKNVKITENELPSRYYETETYGSITRTITRSHTELADWLWISSPFDAEVTVKFGDIDIPFTWKGNPAPEACYLLKEYDAAARATGTSKPWVDVQTSAGNPTIYAGKGYILGVDPRSYEGDFTITFTSVNSENASNNKGYSTETTNLTSEYPTLANNYVVGTGLFETPSGLDFTNNEYSTVFFAVRAEAGSESYYNYYDNDFSMLSPYKSFFMQYGGEYTFKTSTTRQNAPAVAANNNTTERYQLNINSDNYNDKTVIFMAENGTEGYTAGQDFFYMTKTADGGTIGYQFYSLNGEEPLSYNHRKNENQVIQLGGRVKSAGEYTISLEGENINAQSVMLVDTLTGETVDLLINNYTFTTEKGSIDKRFILTFTFAPQTTVDIFTPTANQIIVFGNAQNCTIDNLVIGETIMIFDAMGRMIYNKTANSETINIALPTGTYIVRNANKWAKFAIK